MVTDNPLDLKQYADNWVCLHHPSLPTNVDGMFHMTQSDKYDRYLFIEVKRGEAVTGGQNRMLLALSCLPQFTVLILHSRIVEADDKNCREVVPFFYRRLLDRKEYPPVMTNPEQFAKAYQLWFLGQDPF